MQTGQSITRIPGLAIMFNESVFAAPPLLKSLVARWGCLHETVVMVHVRRVRAASLLQQGLFGNTPSLLRVGPAHMNCTSWSTAHARVPSLVRVNFTSIHVLQLLAQGLNVIVHAQRVLGEVVRWGRRHRALC